MPNKDLYGLFLEGWRPFGWILLAVYVLYVKTLAFQYTMYDDGILIVQNQDFISNILNFRELFKVDVFYPFGQSIYYRPLLTLSLMVDAIIGGARPLVYHATNVLLHGLASCLVFALFRKFSFPRGLSFVCALIFAVHPALSQAVAWISGRNDTLLAVFSFASVISLLEYERSGRARHLLACLVLFTAALFTKESAVALIPLILGYRLISGGKRVLRGDMVFTAGAMAFIVTRWAIARGEALNGMSPDFVGGLPAIFNSLSALLVYLGKAVFPVNLSVIPLLSDSTFVYGLAAAALIVLTSVFLKTGRAWVKVFGLAWFFLFLLPAQLSSITLPVSYMYEHRLYCAMPGLFIFFMEIIPPPFLAAARRNALFAAAAVLIIAAFSARTFIYSDVFATRVSFWSSAVENSPASPLAHLNIASLVFEAGAYGAARNECLTAMALPGVDRDTRAELFSLMGIISLKVNDLPRAQREFRSACGLKPRNANYISNLAAVTYKMGGRAEAARLWKEALRHASDPRPILGNLMRSYYGNKEYARAAAYARMLRQAGGSVPARMEDTMALEIVTR